MKQTDWHTLDPEIPCISLLHVALADPPPPGYINKSILFAPITLICAQQMVTPPGSVACHLPWACQGSQCPQWLLPLWLQPAQLLLLRAPA